MIFSCDGMTAAGAGATTSALGSPHPLRDAFDDFFLRRAEGLFELGGEGDGEVERGDAERSGLEGREMFFRETGDEFGAEAVGATAFVQDDEASRAGEGTFDGFEFQRRERAEIEEVE